jgi:transcriptional regulator with XRE-family HTH domain
VVRLNPDHLDRELGARGLDARTLARLAQVSEGTISRARNGRSRLRTTTYLKLVAAIDRVPRLAVDLTSISHPAAMPGGPGAVPGPLGGGERLA